MSETEPVNEAMIYADAQKAGLNMAKLKVDMENPAIDDAIAASKKLALQRGHRRHAHLHHQWRDASRRGG